MSRELIFGTFHFVRGERRLAYTPACAESTFFDLVKDFYSKGFLATSADFDELHKHGTKNLIHGFGKKVFFTFDDGYIEHYDLCADILEKFDSRGIFFPVVSSLIKRTVLDVNVIQLICANDVYSNIAKKWLVNQELTNNSLVASSGFSPAIFDDTDIQYIKRNLQSSPNLMKTLEGDTGLISEVRENNIEYFDNLYFDHSQACDLFSRGHIVGGHGETHHWLTKLHSQALEAELRTSLSLITDLYTNVEEHHSFFCYPYGLTNENVSMKTLNHFNYCFTTEFGVLTSEKDREIPRVDVNVLREFL